jgi:glycosyltransferase involved in cell wall biosynthesis
LFDPVHYGLQLSTKARKNLEVRRRAHQPASFLEHFLHGGGQHGANPLPAGFDSTWYMRNHPEVSEQNQNPLIHWLTIGVTKGFDPAPEFDTTYYLDENPDIIATGINPLAHYILHGYKERRQPDPLSPEPWDPSGRIDQRKPRTMTDVLFISGVNRLAVPHPPRFRIDHQIEQLESAGVSCQSVLIDNLSLKWLALARVFVFYRCPTTPLVREFIKLAHIQQKKCVFDCDDLVFDAHFTNQLTYLQTMPEEERYQYDDGVWRYRETLELCDAAIASTNVLADQMKEVVPDTFVNRNTASVEMVARAESVLAKREAMAQANDNQHCVVGYFSGSMTHNEDFEMIAPALARVMSEHPEVTLTVAGMLQLTGELQPFSSRVRRVPFMGWRAMFEELAAIDINLAPLTEGVFNESKSENKWIEAALVRVPTLASDVGAFKDVVHDGIDGVLTTPDEWYDKLTRLVVDRQWRRDLGRAAQSSVLADHVTANTGLPVSHFLKGHMNPCLGYVVWGQKTSGGSRVLHQHGAMLQDQAVNVFLLDLLGGNNGKETLPVASGEMKQRMHVDALIATFWPTVAATLKYPYAKVKSYLVQNYESEFYAANDINHNRAQATYCQNELSYLTISQWCRDWLKQSYGHDAAYLPNGIDPALFPVTERDWSGRIRILIEGDNRTPWRNVDEAFAIADGLDREQYEVWYLAYDSIPKPSYRVDRFFRTVSSDRVGEVYSQAHILLKTSCLEGFSYPPLEMMATGGFAVVRPNNGNAEYLRDRENCLLYPPDDPMAAVELIDNLVVDQQLRHRLTEGAQATVRSRSWDVLQPQILAAYDTLLKGRLSHPRYS